MRQSKIFTKTRKEAPKDEVSKNAVLLIRAGFVHKDMAGVYSFLPLGIRVLNNIINIIREEMNAIGGEELYLSALQSKDIWDKTDRWDDKVVDVWFKTKLQNGGDVGLGFTHEEPLTNLMTNHISSYKDLPRYVYQFQNKFRNEVRAKSGLMRTREFLMKDLYSFSKSELDHLSYYEKVKEAYARIFSKLGIGDKTFITLASGGSFSKFSHEFQTMCEAGEDIVYLHSSGTAINKEIYSKELTRELNLDGDFEEVKTVEVGNIFTLGTRFSEPLGLKYKDEEGKEQFVYMGSYGIGPTRILAVIAELFSDEKGLIWPENIAPFKVHLLAIGDSEGVRKEADEVYESLVKKGVSVLYDDRDLRAGEKFGDSDLIGLPIRVVVSEKTIQTGKVEKKLRTESQSELVPVEQLI